jgi:LPS sulfotransferase NodH
VVVAAQRTGSTLLVRSLDSSPAIFCAGEIFHGGPNVYHAEWRYPQRLLGSSILARLADRLNQKERLQRHLRRYFDSVDPGIRAIGFKVMGSQLRRYPALLSLLAELGATLFFLYRRDVFATALSHLRAKASGIYHSDRAAGTASERVVTVDPNDFKALLENVATAQQEVKALHVACGGVLLSYEDMVADWNGFIASIGDVLGFSELRLDKALDKLSDTSSRLRIENEDELRRAFAAKTAI